MKLKLGLLIILLAATAARAQTNDLTLLLQQGLFEEQANRNLDAAIVNYRMLAAQFEKDRQLAATAVFRLGECYRAEGKTNEAAAQYQRILSDFSDQPTLVTLSRQDLAGKGMAELQPRFGAPSKSPEQQVLEIEARRSGAGTNLMLPGEAPDAQDQEIQRIKLLIQNSPDLINAAGNGSVYPPLIQAAHSDFLRVARYLLDNQANVNVKDNLGETALTMAAAGGHRAIVELLLSRGAEVNAKGLLGYTALHQAAKYGFQAVIETLLANHADVNAPDNNGDTPLFLAAANGKLKNVQLLLDAGANPNLKDSEAQTALNYAIRGTPEIMQALLAAGANPNTQDSMGRTPLTYAMLPYSPAMQPASLEVVKTLLAAKADPNIGTLETPLLVAVYKNNIGAAEMFLQSGANPDAAGTIGWNNLNGVVFSDHNGHLTPLWLAIKASETSMVQLLLKYKADPNDAQTDGRSVVFDALDKPDILPLLLNAGANVEVRDLTDRSNTGNIVSFADRLQRAINPDLKRTPLLFAAGGESNLVAITELLQHGANPNVCDGRGDTALHFAARFLADEQIFRSLLDDKANPNVRNNEGETPLDLVKKALLTPFSSNRFPNQNQYGINYGQVSAEQKAQAEKLIALLHQYGALDNLPDWDRISISRPGVITSAPVFQKNTNDWNQFTLLELLLRVYPNPGAHLFPEALTRYPDLGGIVIERPSADGTGLNRIPVNLLDGTNGIDCSRDVPLEFGDVVKIPEREHNLAEGATYLTRERQEAMLDCLKCQPHEVNLVAAGSQSVSLQLQPMFSQIGTVLNRADARAALTSDSDLSRVKVTRQDPQSGKKREWILDCARAVESGSDGYAPDLWLRNGDVVEVPEKQ
jgi:ankyrin repeat protein